MLSKVKLSPSGEIVVRIEFQSRGSPHAHCVLWVKDAPLYGVASNTDIICAFIDQYVTCAIPGDECSKLKQVLAVQQHRHSSYCKRHKSCRFRFPHPPSANTVIAESSPDQEHVKQAQWLLFCVLFEVVF